MGETEVTNVMGTPKQITDCANPFSPYDKRDECVKGYVYASIWAPLNPYYPVIWFGRDGLVLDKFAFSSP
jgi:hypothetical protein